MSLVAGSTRTKPTSCPFSLRMLGGPVRYLISATIEIEEITADRAFGKGAPRVRKVDNRFLDLNREIFDTLQIGSENFYAERAAKPCGKHFRSRLDRHPENVRHTRGTQIHVQFIEKLFPGHAARPLIERFE